MLEGATLAEIRKIAKEKGVSGYSTMSKMALKHALMGDQ